MGFFDNLKKAFSGNNTKSEAPKSQNPWGVMYGY